MLFTFPSRYLFTIGRQGVFSLGGWSPLLPTGFLVSRSTQDSTQLFPDFVYRSVTFFAGPFQTSSTILLQCLFVVLQPQNPWTLVWALSFSLAATGEIDFSFFSSAYLDVSVQRVVSSYLWIQYDVNGYYSIRVAPFGYLRINVCLRLPEAFRS